MAAIKKPSVDAVLVGFGWTGAIMGMELTAAGLKVLALENWLEPQKLGLPML